jgi:hypothetical protein
MVCRAQVFSDGFNDRFRLAGATAEGISLVRASGTRHHTVRPGSLLSQTTHGSPDCQTPTLNC